MIRRRDVYNPLVPSLQPRWLVSRSMYGRALKTRRLEPGTDLVRTFLAAMLELVEAGWQLREFSSAAGHVRYIRAGEQRMLTIEHVDPAQPEQCAPHWGGRCVSCDD